MELKDTLETLRDGFLHKSAEVELLQKKVEEQVRSWRWRPPGLAPQAGGQAHQAVGHAHQAASSLCGGGQVSGGRPGAERHQGRGGLLPEGGAGPAVPETRDQSGDQTQAGPSGQHQRGCDVPAEERSHALAPEDRPDPPALRLDTLLLRF